MYLENLTQCFRLFFYQTGYCEPEDPLSDACTGATASASWWLLFLGPRQAVTWMLAKAMDMFVRPSRDDRKD